ncbi:type I-C CRISPR-associated protein Cas8c/Csd1, partial [Streptomyces sp. NPDC057062]|uniref:type I-C CRISPR-associated protein Cas8c/Csd1 n=1 Tax=Streptomyces sp. NPDC057062 TaxID=3346011 RepID=UPI0036326F38
MLLHSLVQHADSREDAVPDYYQRRPIMWQIDLSSTGEAEPLIIDLRPAKAEEPRKVTAPYTGRSGKNPPPFLLADSALYVLGHPGVVKGPEDKTVLSTDPKDVAKARERLAASRAMV